MSSFAELTREEQQCVIDFGMLHWRIVNTRTEVQPVRLETPDTVKVISFSLDAAAPPVSTLVPKTMTRVGQIGEAQVRDMLSGYDVSIISKESKAMDLKIKTDAGFIGIEVKNYTTTVSKLQIDKFLRDMDVSDYIAAVFVSLNVKIAHRREFDRIYLEESSDGRPIIFVAIESAPSLVCSAVDLLLTLIRSKKKAAEFDSDMVRAADATSDTVSSLLRIKDDLQSTVEQFNRALSKYGERIVLQTEKLKSTSEVFRKLSIQGTTTGGAEEIWDNIKTTYRYKKKELLKLIEILNKDGDEWITKSDKIVHGHVSIVFDNTSAIFEVKQKYLNTEDLESMIKSHFVYVVKHPESEKIGLQVNEFTIDFLVGIVPRLL